ncbi:MAG: hypothetical protein HUU56_07485 [Bdellovibrionaceae bacterium]|nr:hypothetical protein [Pseudobdellovibrionaceae bacterium]
MQFIFLPAILLFSVSCFSQAPSSFKDVQIRDYKELFKRCNGDSCCESSAKRLEKSGGYVLQEGQPFKCPADYSPDGLKCLNSYRWCSPKKK